MTYDFETRSKALEDAIAAGKTPAFVPVLSVTDAAVFAYGGKSIVDSFKDGEDSDTMAKRFAKYYDDVYFDISMGDFMSITPPVIETMEGCTQMCFAPDGSSLENIQKNFMREDEYPELIADPDAYMKNVILPRKFPFLFSGNLEAAVKKVETVIDSQTRSFTEICPKVAEIVAAKGIAPLDASETVMNPLDVLYDNYRGFRGILVDLRRRYAEVKEAVEVLWPLCDKFVPGYEPFSTRACYAAHIVPYINQKTFEELYWPYQKKLLTDIASLGMTTYYICQGSFLNRAEFFNDLPDHSVVIHVDDDDVVQMSKICGERNCISGGCASVLLSHASEEVCKDEAKRIIDECAGTGSFIYSIDKTLSCVGDINANLKKTNLFVHEYGVYR